MGHRPCETSPVPSPTFTTSRSPYAEEFFGVALSGSSHLPWLSLCMKSLALPCSPYGANISTLQDSLHVTGCGFALLSQEDTTLQHLQSPRSTGCLLRGGLTLTATGLAPASRRQLTGHTMRCSAASNRRRTLGVWANTSRSRSSSSRIEITTATGRPFLVTITGPS